MIKITTISSGRTLPRKVTEAMPTKLKVSFLCQKDEIEREREREICGTERGRGRRNRLRK